MSFDLAFKLFIKGSPQSQMNYFLRFLVKRFSNKETRKLTVAPTAANKMVLTISADCKVAAILNNVPPTVPKNVGLFGDCIVVNCKLTHCRKDTTCNSNVASRTCYQCW